MILSTTNKTYVLHNITLNEKMRLATIDNVWYIRQSTLIPLELKREVQNGHFTVPPVVMSHCVRFLCYHHLYYIVNRLVT